METKADVKGIRARFQANTEDSTPSSSVPGRLRTTFPPALSSGSPSAPSLPKNSALESLPGRPRPLQPPFPKTSSSSSFGGAAVDSQELAKARASRFSYPQKEHSGMDGSKPLSRSKEQVPEATPPRPKLPAHKPFVSVAAPEARPAFPKPPPVVPTSSKPSWVRETGGGGGAATPSKVATPPKPPTQQKPTSGVAKLQLHGEATTKADSESKHGNGEASRLPTGFTIPGSAFNARENVGRNTEKTNTNLPNTPLPKPLATKRPSFIRSQVDSLSQISQDEEPRRNPPPSIGQDGEPRRYPPPSVSVDGEPRRYPPPSVSVDGEPRRNRPPSVSQDEEPRRNPPPSIGQDGEPRRYPPPSVSVDGELRRNRPPSVSRDGEPRRNRPPSVSRDGEPRRNRPPSVSRDGEPRRNPLPSVLKLGPTPSKPGRPPRVNLDNFRTADMAPPPAASHPGHHSNRPVNPMSTSSVQTVAPILPPRHPGIIEPDPEENYDDVAVMKNLAPPPPPTTGRPRMISKQDDSSDGETYEDLDERWEASELKEQEKRKENLKEEKKRLEAEKKEQKERDKKEQEARKKFKLGGSLEVMHRVKVVMETRGSKTDLALKKGDWVDILRIHDNPEGKWLGRSENGSFGYLNNDCVEVDLDSWKQQQGILPPRQMLDPEVYDDVEHASEDLVPSGIKGPRVDLPPPEEDDGEIYDDVVEAIKDVSLSEAPKPSPKTRLLRMFEKRKTIISRNQEFPSSQFSSEGNSAGIDDDIYDDIDTEVTPPPLPLNSPPPLKAKMEEVDPKRQKKFEKEEKEFRKKFKYDGDIQVLYQVTIIPTLSIKKSSGKDLQVKPGETLDVVIGAVDKKLVCRNQDGKFGTVQTRHVVMDDGDIYDDIGEECIYDND
ncbi:hypothetical protein NHX12_027706 [Muraenolepis orangiensis]|uniref:SH3 domain-containing protein n=1 Tax=Muraenolepis orangiensis TaxID=630683 RepID=A0A9Q0EF16_9TELE|nr:hypothetical protein NHX12_027706 [Muraenolepis orangiensis]